MHTTPLDQFHVSTDDVGNRALYLLLGREAWFVKFLD